MDIDLAFIYFTIESILSNNDGQLKASLIRATFFTVLVLQEAI